ncbi:hypothetical protein QQF64_011829 [Cirrhinus molitorella]|uniref:Uncharacterized protein n=1 Tax=Cirrhinus molitorella TaxID=172907 RepID=A0ABR3LWZ0_9TELE
MNWAENLISSIPQDGRPLELYVEFFHLPPHTLVPATKTSTYLNIGIISFSPEATPIQESTLQPRESVNAPESAPVHL